jgi:hypothetical protein
MPDSGYVPCASSDTSQAVEPSASAVRADTSEHVRRIGTRCQSRSYVRWGRGKSLAAAISERVTGIEPAFTAWETAQPKHCDQGKCRKSLAGRDLAVRRVLVGVALCGSVVARLVARPRATENSGNTPGSAAGPSKLIGIAGRPLNSAGNDYSKPPTLCRHTTLKTPHHLQAKVTTYAR